ncbi:MAG TPA: hypothetical protein VF989_03025 [Polyangiaceae bacterium]
MKDAGRLVTLAVAPIPFSLWMKLRVALVATALSACGGKLENPEDFPSVYQPGTGIGGASSVTGTGGSTTAGGAGTGGGPGCDVPATLERRCGTFICHGGVAAPQLELVASGVEQRLIDQPASYAGVVAADAPSCPTPPELLISTADPMASLMIKKLDGTQACGSVMPLSAFPESSEEDDTCIRQWSLGLAMGMTTGL